MDGQLRSEYGWIRVDVEIFESGKKSLRIKKYPDTCGQGLRDKVLAKLNEFKYIPINFTLACVQTSPLP